MRAAVFSLGTVMGTGCLIPQEDTVLDRIVLPNNAPLIMEQTVQPPAAPEFPMSLDNCKYEFTAFVQDADVDDRVTYRWYIDFDPIGNTDIEDEQTFVNNGEAVRPFPAAFTVITSPQHPELGTAGSHTIWLMVYDGVLTAVEGPGQQPSPEPIPGADASITRYSTTFTWQVISDPLAPCDETP